MSDRRKYLGTTMARKGSYKQFDARDALIMGGKAADAAWMRLADLHVPLPSVFESPAPVVPLPHRSVAVGGFRDCLRHDSSM